MERWNQATIFTFESRRIYEDPCDDGGDRESGVGFASDICGRLFRPIGNFIGRDKELGYREQHSGRIEYYIQQRLFLEGLRWAKQL